MLGWEVEAYGGGRGPVTRRSFPCPLHWAGAGLTVTADRQYNRNVMETWWDVLDPWLAHVDMADSM